ncbi:hypothetical protein MMC11_007692 [Xylographa trunciseda]|nr:hypothetical protein [Xylographa trunciseda]
MPPFVGEHAVVVSQLPPGAFLTDEALVAPSHHVGTPPTSFRNPWPSFVEHSRWDILKTRFSSERNFVPVPPRDELVAIRSPDWGDGKDGLKATWIGHATFLVEMAADPGRSRGVRLLFDPLWSERTSPVSWLGPKRYTPTPCALQDIPAVDLVVISHNHYDHLDVDTIRRLHQAGEGRIHFLCALGNAAWFHGLGIHRNDVTELDWWQAVRVDVGGVGSLNLTCTPSQHISGRSGWDFGNALWCSWVVEELGSSAPEVESNLQNDSPQQVSDPLSSIEKPPRLRNLFFAGDTGYRAVPSSMTALDDSTLCSSLPHCPAFAEIGDRFGPFDLALLPIGLYSPRHLLSSVHAAPEDSVCVHLDIKSKMSIGMHWGTVRGGLSAQFEDVREPPRRWREAAEKKGLVWGRNVGLLDIGETFVVD